MRRSHHRNPGVLRETLGDQRDAGTAADRHHRGDTGPVNPVVPQQVFQRGEHALERLCDQALELGSRHPNVGPVSGQFDDQFGRRIGRQPLLGDAAFLAQPGQRTDRRGACGIDIAGVGDAVSDVAEQRLVDLVAGEFGIAGRLADGLERRRGVGQRDAGATATEIQQRHHTGSWEAGVGVQRGQRGDGIGTARACRWAQVGGAQRVAQRPSVAVPNAPVRLWRSASDGSPPAT